MWLFVFRFEGHRDKNLVFTPSGQPSSIAYANIQNSCVMEVVHSLLSLPLINASSLHICLVATSMAVPVHG